MEDFRADLHSHTYFSDGTYSPQELIDEALQKGLSGLSITDHDSIHSYAIALPYAKEKKLPLLSGVEFSTLEKNEPIHILGYSFSLHHPSVIAFCEKHKKRRNERNLAILEQLRKEQMPITLKEIEECIHSEFQQIPKTLGRPHIAVAMMKKGYVNSVKEAFRKFLGEGKSCFVTGHSLSVEETLDVIHQAKGFAVIAHPHLIKNGKLVQNLLEMPFDGIEGYYALFSESQNKKWIEWGKKKNLLITGGSDFHGKIKPEIQLGSSFIGKETFSFLYERFIENQIIQ